MAHAVFQHKPESIYPDILWERYVFPKGYLGVVREALGDWIAYYETGKALGGRGRRAYFAVARLSRTAPMRRPDGLYEARIAPGTYLELPCPVPQILDGRAIESVLEEAPGRLRKGGAVTLAVRRLPGEAFARLVAHGLGPATVTPAEPGFAEAAAPFERPVVERLVSTRERERAFRARVLEAYGGTCAVSGLSLRNGGGWMEVEAAHIRAVADGGPDMVQNGLALSATLHRMFDRGLFTISDSHEIIVSENKVPRAVQDRLFRPERRIMPPDDRRLWPDPRFLAHHREHRFGGGDGSATWHG